MPETLAFTPNLPVLEARPAKFLIRDIERAVCLRFRLTPEQLRGQDRRRAVARPRQIAMYLARQITGASLPQIGRYFGGRDHTTVLWACRKITAMLAQGGRMPGYVEGVREIMARLQSHRGSVAA